MSQSVVEKTKLNALILIGGKSKRMGTDKSVLDYYGKPQWQYLVDLAKKYVDSVYISVRPNQRIDYPNIITDKEAGLGPFGAILSALETKPNEAFLVIATDLPFINQNSIELLLQNRDMSKGATALQGKNKDYPEPLATIWEPCTLNTLQDFYNKKIYKPIQVLKSMSVNKVVVDDQIIQNINTNIEFEKIKKQLEK